MRISNPFRYMMREAYPSVGTVYKAWFGRKYLIWKAKSLHQSLNSMAVDLDQRLRLGLKQNDVYAKVVQHIRNARVTIFEVEVLIQSDNPVDLLIGEYKALKAGENDEMCLNTSFFPNIPGWMPQTAKDEFQQFVMKMAAQKKEQAKKSTKSKKGQAGREKKLARKSSKKATPIKRKKAPVKKKK